MNLRGTGPSIVENTHPENQAADFIKMMSGFRNLVIAADTSDSDEEKTDEEDARAAPPRVTMPPQTPVPVKPDSDDARGGLLGHVQKPGRRIRRSRRNTNQPRPEILLSATEQGRKATAHGEKGLLGTQVEVFEVLP